MVEDRVSIIQWYIKYLNQQASELSPNELEWAIKIEDVFKKKNYLSKREFEILEDIYYKH